MHEAGLGSLLINSALPVACKDLESYVYMKG